MNLVNNIFGTDLNDGVQLAIVFAVLLVVLLLVVWLIRVVFGNNVSRMAKNRQPRLAVTDAAIVDDKRRLVLVRRDNVEHLILIGGNSDVLLESNISRVTPVQVPVTDNVTDNVTATSTNNNQPKLEQKKTEQKELLLKNRAKSFSTITSGSDKVGKVAKSGIASAVGLTAIGAGAIASAKNAVANTSTNTADVISSAKGSVSSIVDTGASVAKTATQTVVETASNTSKAANVTAKDTVSNFKNVVNAEKEVDDLAASVVVDEPIVDKIKEVNLDQDSAIQKSAAELDLEKVLADDTAISDTSTGEDDMQKILDELTAEIK